MNFEGFSLLYFLQMNLVNYIQFLEPLQENFTRVYSTASGVITVLVVLWLLNFVAGLIQRTYSIGKAFGNFYRSYLQRYIASFLSKLSPLLLRSESNHQKKNSPNTVNALR